MKNRFLDTLTWTLNGWTAAALLLGATVVSTTSLPAQETSADKQRQCLDILKSGAPAPDKAIACKKLAIYGSKEAVPALAPLLADKELASWARIALEAITDSSADAALRDAVPKLQGLLLVGVINSIGYRRDAAAIGALENKIADRDPEVAAAAADALGRIGQEKSAKILLASLAKTSDAAVRSAVALGCIRCAEHLLAQAQAANAIKLYDAVREAKVPKQRMIEAIRGAILARQAAGLPLLLEQLRSADKARVDIGLRTARELPGREVTEALAAELERSSLGRQSQLILVLADRADVAALPTIRKYALTGQKQLRLAAIGALDRMGNASTVPVLLDVAAETDPELAQAARVALARLPGKDVDGQLLKQLPTAKGSIRRVLTELAGQRQITEALPTVLTSVDDPDAGVRGASYAAIGMLGGQEHIANLVQLLEKKPAAKDRSDLEKALLAITGRCGASSLNSLNPLVHSTDKELRMVALHALASVGGPKALLSVSTAAQMDPEAVIQDEAVRTLSTWPNSWPEDNGVADPLLKLAKSGKKTSHQVLGIRGYLQYLQGARQLADADRMTKINQVVPLIKRVEEKRLAIAALGTIPVGESLELLTGWAADEALTEDACNAIANLIAEPAIKTVSKEIRRKAYQIAAEKSTSDATKRKAQNALRGVK